MRWVAYFPSASYSWPVPAIALAWYLNNECGVCVVHLRYHNVVERLVELRGVVVLVLDHKDRLHGGEQRRPARVRHLHLPTHSCSRLLFTVHSKWTYNNTVTISFYFGIILRDISIEKKLVLKLIESCINKIKTYYPYRSAGNLNTDDNSQWWL